MKHSGLSRVKHSMEDRQLKRRNEFKFFELEAGILAPSMTALIQLAHFGK